MWNRNDRTAPPGNAVIRKAICRARKKSGALLPAALDRSSTSLVHKTPESSYPSSDVMDDHYDDTIFDWQNNTTNKSVWPALEHPTIRDTVGKLA